MKIYKADGSFVEDKNDTEFGLYFSEIVIDEARLNFAEINRETLAFSRLRKSLQKYQINGIYDSIDLPDENETFIIEKHDPKIKMQPIQDILECKMEPEGLVQQDKGAMNDLTNIDLKVPHKEDLTNLIIPHNIETNVLLSVISFAKYKSLQKTSSVDNIFRTINFKATNFKHLNTEEYSEEINNNILWEIENYHANKEDNMLSLMMELILADRDCDMEDLHTNSKEIDKKTSTPQNFDETKTKVNKINNVKIDIWRKPRGTGASVLNINTDNVSDELCKMHVQLREIRESFQVEENRVQNLLEEATQLKRDLKETICLNDILHLLNGNLEKVKSKKWPFRIFHKRHQTESEVNLIV